MNGHRVQAARQVKARPVKPLRSPGVELRPGDRVTYGGREFEVRVPGAGKYAGLVDENDHHLWLEKEALMLVARGPVPPPRGPRR